MQARRVMDAVAAVNWLLPRFNSWTELGQRILLVLVIAAALASVILVAKHGPPEDMGCGFDYSGFPIPCQAPGPE